MKYKHTTLSALKQAGKQIAAKMKSSFRLSKKCRSCTKIALVAKATPASQQRTTISIQLHSGCHEKHCGMCKKKILLIILWSFAWAWPRRTTGKSRVQGQGKEGSRPSPPQMQGWSMGMCRGIPPTLGHMSCKTLSTSRTRLRLLLQE